MEWMTSLQVCSPCALSAIVVPALLLFALGAGSGLTASRFTGCISSKVLVDVVCSLLRYEVYMLCA